MPAMLVSFCILIKIDNTIEEKEIKLSQTLFELLL